MSPGYTNQVKDTAFIVCCNRAKSEKLCGDTLARHWVPDSAWESHARYCTDVTSHDDLLTGLRFKFFSEKISDFFNVHKNGVLINIAAGFSSYAYFPGSPETIEVESPLMSIAKQSIAMSLSEKGLINAANVSYFACDLTCSQQLLKLQNHLQQKLSGRPSFVLLEGLLYYLPIEAINVIFAVFMQIQKPQDQIALSAWNSYTKDKQVFHRYLQFMKETMGLAPSFFTFLDTNYFKKLSGYQISEFTELSTLARNYFSCNDDLVEDTELFSEDLYILRRESK